MALPIYKPMQRTQPQQPQYEIKIVRVKNNFDIMTSEQIIININDLYLFWKRKMPEYTWGIVRVKK